MNKLFYRIHDDTPNEGRGNKAEPRLKWRTSQYFKELKKITGLRSAQGLANFINNNLLEKYPHTVVSRKSIDNYTKGKRVFSDEVLKTDIESIIHEKVDDKTSILSEIWNSPLIYASSSKYDIKDPHNGMCKEIKLYWLIGEIIDFSLIYLSQEKLKLVPKRKSFLLNESEKTIQNLICIAENISTNTLKKLFDNFFLEQIFWEARISNLILDEQQKSNFKKMIYNNLF